MQREEMQFDVVIVGAGPAGLAAAIRLKQGYPELSVVVLEKAAAIGVHTLSGAVVDPSGIDVLLPGWRDEPGHPFSTPVTDDQFFWLTSKRAFRLPNLLMPPLMNNHGNFVVSLGKVVRWLGDKAEALGVEIYPGFAGAGLVYGDQGQVLGVLTSDQGRLPDGGEGPSFAPGMALLGRYVLIAEGARGSLTRELIARFSLDAGRDPQKYGLGIKELWEVDPALHRTGLVQHSFGWPLSNDVGGGSFLYHLEGNQVAVGYVVHLNYANPYLSPFEEFQRFKTHPAVRGTFVGGKRIGYGARAITEGGWQSVPKLGFPGGLLLGCAAGFVNVPRIKGSHNAVLSGIAAADHVAIAIVGGRANDEIVEYDRAWREGPIGSDLRAVRNVKPLWSRWGTLLGIALGGLDMWCHTLFGRSVMGTLTHGKPDHSTLAQADRSVPINYPKPDNVLTFDRLSSVFLSNTSHPEGQPAHLVVADAALQQVSEYGEYAGPSGRYCPASVYEWMAVGDQPPQLVINASNCIHCKTCDIKDPNQNITWRPPENGGPNYSSM